jgi:hypothetical protein
MFAGSGYLGSSEPILLFGLGSADSAAMVSVRWSTGHLQNVETVAAGQILTIEEEAPPTAPPFEMSTLIAILACIGVIGLLVWTNRKPAD